MTAKLNLRLNKFLGGANTEAGAVAQIYAIDEKGERDFARDRTDLVIPAGFASTPLQVDLDPGRYLVEATLPSGDIANGQVKLVEGATVGLDLVAQGSLHEWQSWQQYLGNAPAAPAAEPRGSIPALPTEEWLAAAPPPPEPPPPSAPRMRRMRTQLDRVERYVAKSWAEQQLGLERGVGGMRPPPPPSAPRPTRSRAKVDMSAERSAPDWDAVPPPPAPPPFEPPSPPKSPRAIAPRLPSWPAIWFIHSPVEALAGVDGKGKAAWALVIDKATLKDPVKALAARKPLRVPHRDRDDLRAKLTVGGDGPVLSDTQDPSDRTPPPRRYLVAVQSRGPCELACLPVPWDAGSYGRVPVEILVRREPLRGEATLAMSPKDPGVAAALGYVGSSNLKNARVVFDQAKDLLFGKMINALGAAAGGYVLLATEHGPGEHEWHEWIRNLSTRFQWLPDGMIQYGRLRLQRRQTEADIDDARKAFFVAYDRGLPYYSLGLQWLVDGLSLLASRDDPEARRRLSEVQEVLWRANLAQPFTTIRLRD